MGSRSSSASTTSTQQFDQRTAGTDGAIVAGPNATLTVTDPAALQDVIGLVASIIEGAGELASEAVSQSAEASAKAFGLAEARSQSEGAGLMEKAIIVGGVVLVGVALSGGLK